MDKNIVILQNREAAYPEKQSMFKLHVAYSEYNRELSRSDNLVYEMVREYFHTAGYDAKNYRTPEWNSLKDYVKPGDYVVLRPNCDCSSKEQGAYSGWGRSYARVQV